MHTITRRSFIQRLAVGGAAGVTASLLARGAASAAPHRRFTMALECGAIGVSAKQAEALQMAARHGFEAVAPSTGELAAMSDSELDELAARLKQAGLVWGAAGLNVDFRKDEATFRNGLQQLPAAAKALARVGATRVGTWLRPAHDTLTYMANLRQHRIRLREIAAVLGEHQLRFGLEYVGPKTSWTAGRFPFVHTLTEALELIAEIGQANVGLVLDSWHWYTAHESREDLLHLKNDNIVACDLNDAPAGIAIDEQLDGRRELPASTGVIDLRAFLGTLVEIGYDGPVRAEPFNQALRALENDAALATTAAAMKKALALVD